jgi:hypothetical protein
MIPFAIWSAHGPRVSGVIMPEPYRPHTSIEDRASQSLTPVRLRLLRIGPTRVKGLYT